MPSQATQSFFREFALKACRRANATRLPAHHQNLALAKMHSWYESLSGDGDGGILVLPTGAGKTFTAAHFLANGPLSHGYKVLWLAHTHHLLEQAFYGFREDVLKHVREPRESLKLRVVSGTPGHFPARDIKSSDDVVIATLQTITHAFEGQLAALRRFIVAARGKLFVVFDEAHHSPAPSYRKLLLSLRDEGAAVLGLTATPTYSDESKRGWLAKLFPQGILFQARAGELIAAGVLAKPHFEQAPTAFTPTFDDREYQKWLGTYRDIPEGVISLLAQSAERNAFIAETYTRNQKRYGKTIIFADRWLQCEAIVEALRKRGVKADAVYSHLDAPTTSVEARRRRTRDENAKVLERFRSNELDVLVNVRMLTEGTDIPDARTVFLTRQTTSRILLTQMVGRALRGPKFGGTPDAFVVSFTDDWQQAIGWAEYDPLAEGQADDGVRSSRPRIPLHLISIDLVKRLARQMDRGVNVNASPFTSLMPAGWYRVIFDNRERDGDEVEFQEQLVMIFDDEREGFESLITTLIQSTSPALENEEVQFDDQRPLLESLQDTHLGGVARTPDDLLRDIFQIGRHVAQGHGAPEFFPFDAREDHDLDTIAQTFIDNDLGPRAIQAALQSEFEREDRYWKVLFPRFDQFRSYHDACQARLMADGDVEAEDVLSPTTEAPSPREPDEAVKERVKQRCDHRCLACGSTSDLQVDHIKPFWGGGSNDESNLQALCKGCNAAKGTRSIRFRTRKRKLRSDPVALEGVDLPEDPRDRDEWARFLRRTINFTLGCGAIKNVTIGGRGDTYYNWTVRLFAGNSPQPLQPLLAGLLQRVQTARSGARMPLISRITVTASGECDAYAEDPAGARTPVKKGPLARPSPMTPAEQRQWMDKWTLDLQKPSESAPGPIRETPPRVGPGSQKRLKR